EWASRRCAALILEVAGGTLRRGVIDIAAPSPARAPIGFRHEQVSRITGIEISWERCAEIFRGLGFEVAGDPGSSITVLPPSWRVDLDREIDLIEEVIRVHGLHHIPVETDMRVALVTDRHPARVRTIVKDTLVACGFLETLTTSFLPEKAARISFFSETEPVTISNAMRKEEDALRQSLLPSLLAVRKTNQDRYNDDVRVAECTVVYLARPGLEIPEHLPIVGGLLDGDLREARGVVERLLNGLGIENPVFTALDDHAAAILDEGARVALSDGTTLGYVGRPQAALCESNDLRVTPRYFELRLDVLGAHADLQPAFRPLSKFPPVKRDLAVVVDEGLSWGEIETLIRSLELPDLEELVVFDEYRGKQVGDGKKSLAFSLNYRSFERTLTGEEVDQAQARVISALSDRFQAVVRS
ncbi:MAG: phenylalanine--tRNA ligase subunit beta, partial [Planctomycetes bacterium]|nr:phenylalanine--tRNA ligase subunit beta [Planctomycetota bacterium]